MQKGQRSDLKLMKGFPYGCASLLVHGDGAFTWQPCACSLSFKAVSDCHIGRRKVLKMVRKRGFSNVNLKDFLDFFRRQKNTRLHVLPAVTTGPPALTETKQLLQNRAVPAIAFRMKTALTSRGM